MCVAQILGATTVGRGRKTKTETKTETGTKTETDIETETETDIETDIESEHPMFAGRRAETETGDGVVDGNEKGGAGHAVESGVAGRETIAESVVDGGSAQSIRTTNALRRLVLASGTRTP